MKALILALLLILNHSVQAQNYLVTNANDTISFAGNLSIVHKLPSARSKIIANDKVYKLDLINTIQHDGVLYKKVQNRRMCKRVIEGKINVYAINERDTIHDRNRQLKKELFIQKEENGKIVSFNNGSLLKMITDNTQAFEKLDSVMHVNEGGKPLAIGGIVVMSVSLLVTVSTFMFFILDGGDAKYLKYTISGAAGLATGAAGLFTGLKLNSKNKKRSLDLIYYYNSQ